MGTIPVGSGLAAQLVVKDEVTYGVAPSLTSSVDSFEFKSETIELKKTAVEGEGLGSGRVFRRTKRRVLTNYDVNGNITMEVPTRNLGFWLRYMVGDFAETPTALGGGIYQTVFQPVSTLKGHSFCAQKGAPAADNAAVEPFTYVGNKLSGWDISVATGGIAQMTLHVDGRNELAGAGNGDPLNGSVPALATWTPVTSGLGMSVFHFRQATLFTGGTPTLAGGITIAPPAVPASGTPQANATGQNIWVTVIGGTVTAVTVNGVQLLSGDGSCLLPPGGTITLTYSAAPTWTWKQAVVSLAGETAAGNVKDCAISQSYSLDANRIFLGANGFKGEQIENGYRNISGSFTVEWLSSEAYYNAYSADTTSSLQLTFTGATVGGQTYLLDVIVPNIKFNGESVKVPGPAVLTQAMNFTGYDDETTVPLQITYQSEDISF
jgi:Phage tail tube protein